MLLGLALSCVPATVYGMRFDGSMPVNSELSAVGGVFPGSSSKDGASLADTTVAGLEGRQRLGKDIALELSAGLPPASLDSESVYGVAELEVQGRILNERPLTLSVLGGISTFTSISAEEVGTPLLGAQVGAVASHRFEGAIRPYAGFKVNPVGSLGDKVYWWFTYGGGVSWRPKIDDSTRGLLALEASGYHGFGTGYTVTGAEGLDVTLGDPTDQTTWGLMLQLGASFGDSER